MIVYGICLSPNVFVLVMCFGMPFQVDPKFSPPLPLKKLFAYINFFLFILLVLEAVD